MSEEEVPWPDDAPPEDEEHDGREYDRWRGTISEWKPPGPKGGPARFKIGNTPVQVWPKEYQSDEDNPVFLDAKAFAFDGAFVEAYGEEKDGKPFYSERAKRDITPTNRTVYGIEKAERADGEDDPKPVGPSAKKEAGKARRNGSGDGRPDSLTKEEWAEKDRLQHGAQSVWAAFKILVPAAANLGLMTDDGLNISVAKLEKGVRALVALGHKLVDDRELFPTRNLSTSGSTTAPAAPAESPSPQPEKAAASSKRPSRAKKSGADG